MVSFGHGTALLAKSGLGLQAAGVGQYVPLASFACALRHSCNLCMQPKECKNIYKKKEEKKLKLKLAVGLQVVT